MTVHWWLDLTKAVNNRGKVNGDEEVKIRRSERLKNKQERTAVEKAQADALSRELGALTLHGQPSQRPRTPPRAPTTPDSQVHRPSSSGLVATHELDVISPESMSLEKERSKDEEIVNSALLHLLVTTTLCSGIYAIPGGKDLAWLPTRQSFRLGPPNRPVCEARTDGLLYKTGDQDCILAILEVKPYTRSGASQLKIEWQEACQMAAWISTSLDQKSKEKRKEGILRPLGDSKKDRYVYLLFIFFFFLLLFLLLSPFLFLLLSPFLFLVLFPLAPYIDGL
jgi:hypothetical protein